MKHVLDSIRHHGREPSVWLDKLAAVFNAMDAGYEQAAGQYGFICRGCEENCCRSRFYHHTLVEYMAIYTGYSRLVAEERRQVIAQASAYCRQHAEADAKGVAARAWCPLNAEGRCMVYELRPMICRLHGIPHVLQHPGGRTVKGPGCEYFGSQHGTEGHFPLDRTPFYRAVAGLEKEFRAALDVNVKIKQTIAEMILSFRPERWEEQQGEKP